MINNQVNQAGFVVTTSTEMMKVWGQGQESRQPELYCGYLVSPLHSAGIILFFWL